MSTDNSGPDRSRRSFIAKGVYAAPLVLTVKAAPAFASQGSSRGSSETNDNTVDGSSVEPYQYHPPKNVPGARASHQSGSGSRRRSRWSWFVGLFGS
jgi:hypothetical protein